MAIHLCSNGKANKSLFPVVAESKHYGSGEVKIGEGCNFSNHLDSLASKKVQVSSSQRPVFAQKRTVLHRVVATTTASALSDFAEDRLDEWNIPARNIGGPFLVSDNEDGKLMGSLCQFNEPY
ncbi:hypothetical protein C5167_050413 [Papaver somniferum]|uniref:Uncharacterized protein n=1 Tax=Papaver somniferum TaxID=3469 RepID=A0A4Y7KNL4_PAPSO|nr:hypothetical protein C5167_050413 [Papaver somniferum]